MTEPIGGAPKILQSKEVGSKSGMDKKQKIQLALLAVLIPFLLYLVFTTIFSGSKAPSPEKTGAYVAATNAASVSAGSARKAVRPQGGVAEEKWGFSPFSLRRQEEDQVQKGPLQLQGIVFDDLGSPYAIVNRKIVKVGDRIADNTLKGIRAGEVIFQSDEGVSITLKS